MINAKSFNMLKLIYSIPHLPDRVNLNSWYGFVLYLSSKVVYRFWCYKDRIIVLDEQRGQ